jgi:hypothetical protein
MRLIGHAALISCTNNEYPTSLLSCITYSPELAMEGGENKWTQIDDSLWNPDHDFTVESEPTRSHFQEYFSRSRV